MFRRPRQSLAALLTALAVLFAGVACLCRPAVAQAAESSPGQSSPSHACCADDAPAEPIAPAEDSHSDGEHCPHCDPLVGVAAAPATGVAGLEMAAGTSAQPAWADKSRLDFSGFAPARVSGVSSDPCPPPTLLRLYCALNL